LFSSIGGAPISNYWYGMAMALSCTASGWRGVLFQNRLFAAPQSVPLYRRLI